jgi:hypothetical protein
MYTGIRSSRNRISEILEFDPQSTTSVEILFLFVFLLGPSRKRAKILFLLEQELKNRNPVPARTNSGVRKDQPKGEVAERRRFDQ